MHSCAHMHSTHAHAHAHACTQWQALTQTHARAVVVQKLRIDVDRCDAEVRELGAKLQRERQQGKVVIREWKNINISVIDVNNKSVLVQVPDLVDKKDGLVEK